MKTLDAINHFGTASKMVSALERCTHQAVSQWGEYPPYGRQCEIELLTAGTLKREPKKQPPCHHHPETKVS
ncbi:MAG: Cro/CI family transcriptional regulator [Paraglaciecola sp.]